MSDSPKALSDQLGARKTNGTGSGEFAAIEQIRSKLAGLFSCGDEEVWIGDDAAVLRAGPGPLLFTTDLTVEGVHADLAFMGLEDLGWRALVASVSDIAAMGGNVAHAVVAVAGPPSTNLETLYEGVGQAARDHGCPVVGGDLSTADRLVVCVSAVGRVTDGPPPVLRSGARPGDLIMVTGPLGSSAAGLRVLRARQNPSGEGGANPVTNDAQAAALVRAHVRPRARLSAGDQARRAGASAMIDISDGLAADLGHIADASGVGFALDEIPVASGALLDDALGGGEDYELVFSASDPGRVRHAFDSAGLVPPVVIGAFTADRGSRTLQGETLSPIGFEHPWNRR